MSLAWGGHKNGQIPPSALRKATVIKGSNGLLRTDASKALDRLAVQAKRDGYDVQVTDLYRTYATQVRLRQQWCDRGRCHMAATPGTSNHGWAMATDNGYGYGPKSFGRWMHANESLCNKNGWIWPAWARTTRMYEPWHWEYNPSRDQYLNQDVSVGQPVPMPPPEKPQEDFDMLKHGDKNERIPQLVHLVNRVIQLTGGWNMDGPAHLTPTDTFGSDLANRVAHAIARIEQWVLFHPIYANSAGGTVVTNQTEAWMVNVCVALESGALQVGKTERVDIDDRFEPLKP